MRANPFTLGIEGWSLVLKRMTCELQPTRSQPPQGTRGDSRAAKMILVVGGPLKIPLWGKWWLTVLCLDFLTRCLGSCHRLLFSVGSRFPWPSPAGVTTLNQELAVTQLSLAILMRNLVLLDYCSWATSCQQFLRKLFNHPQLQRNRWHTGGGGVKHFQVYVLVTSKCKDTKASASSGPKSTFTPPPQKKWTCGCFCFPSLLTFELPQSWARICNGETVGHVRGG